MAVKSNRTSKQTEAEKLRKENEKLKTELKKYQNSNPHNKRSINWRSAGKWACLSLAGAIFIVASLSFYAGMTLTNTDRFMKVASPLIQQSAVQDAIAKKTTDALFKQVDVEGLAEDVLPPRVEFLAPTVATQIQAFTYKEAKNVIASSSFQEAYNTAVRNAHERLITSLKNYEGDGTIDINAIYSNLSQRLEGGKLDFLAGKKLPPKIGNITIIQADWLPAAHAVVANFQAVRVTTIILFFLLLALAIYLSSNRRKTLVHIGWLIALLSLAILIALRIARNIYMSNVDPAFEEAAQQIWTVFIRPFGIQMITTMVIGLALVGVAWLGGQSRSASSVKNKINLLFAGKVHESLFRRENTFTLWVGRYEKVLLGFVGAAFLFSLLVIDLTLGGFLTAMIVAILVSFLIVSLSGKDKTTTS